MAAVESVDSARVAPRGKLSSTHSWSGGILFADAGKAGALPTFSGAWHFTWVYSQTVWKGFLVALLVADGGLGNRARGLRRIPVLADP